MQRLEGSIVLSSLSILNSAILDNTVDFFKSLLHTHEKAQGIVFFRTKIKNIIFFEILGSELRAPHSFPTVLGKKELKTAISSEFLAI